ncbi:uncharacterized protein PFLUO_LOCUS5347 [Penicillium psychrofluorescens]|uniref:uncharacterized protein n=1 Tax=Penicillium psychrofluorescens TaxID=3158075 RepID=UPI003CCD332A
MGFTAIWITPVTYQLQGNTGDGTAYHGYWQQDAYALNSNYGSAADLKSLASALHDRGMYLMVDVVANHMGYNGAGNTVDYSIFNPFNSQSYFHPYCLISNDDNQTNVDDFVQKMWYTWVHSLVSNYSIDGLRVDTVGNVQKGFWPGYNKAAGVYCVGEVFNGDVDFTCPYQDVIDGVLDYPMYFPLLRAFESTSGSISDLYDMINSVRTTCSDSTLLGTFVENHDNPRFASYTEDMSLAKNAATFTIMSDGIPIVYAGQEQHYNGGNDPYNREATWLSGYNTSSVLYKLIAQTNAIRSHAITKDSRYITSKNYPIYQDENTLAMHKGSNSSQTITILSNLGESGSTYTLSLAKTGFTSGMALTEIFTCAKITVDASGNVPVPMASGEPRILYPSSKLASSGIC